jgi:hypothetical protein
MGEQLLAVDQPLEGLLDELLAGAQDVEDLRTEDEEAPVDAHVGATHVVHARDPPIRTALDEMERLGRDDADERSDGVALAEPGDVGVEVEIREPVGVVREKHRLALEMRPDGGEPLADVRLETRIDERDRPVGDVVAEQLDRSSALAQPEVVREPLVVVDEVVLDGFGAVPEAEDEVPVPVVGVVLHEVPEDRALADRDEGLRHGLRVVAQAHAHAAAEEHHLHRIRLRSASELNRRPGLPGSGRRIARPRLECAPFAP